MCFFEVCSRHRNVITCGKGKMRRKAEKNKVKSFSNKISRSCNSKNTRENTLKQLFDH